MTFAVAIGVLSAIVVLIVMARIDLKKFMGYPAVMDASVTVLLAVLLHGSYVGMVAAIIGGLFFSVMITFIRRAYGYKKVERRGVKLVWVEYPPAWIEKSKTTINNLSHIGDTKSCSNLKLSAPLISCIAVLLLLACVL